MVLMGEAGSRSTISNHLEFKISSREGINKLQDAEGMVNIEHMEGELEWDSLILTSDSPNGTNVRPNLSPERMNLLDNQLLHTFNRGRHPRTQTRRDKPVRPRGCARPEGEDGSRPIRK